jgi:hypothetical protein
MDRDLEDWMKIARLGGVDQTGLEVSRDETLARLQVDTDRARRATAAVFHRPPAPRLLSPREIAAAEVVARHELRQLLETLVLMGNALAKVERSAARAKQALDEIETANAEATKAVNADLEKHLREQLADEGEPFDLDNLPVDLTARHGSKIETAQRLALLLGTWRNLRDEATVKTGLVENLRRRVAESAWAVARLEADKLASKYLEARHQFEALEDLLHGMARTPRGDNSGVGHLSPGAVAALAPRENYIVGNANDPRAVAIRKWHRFQAALLTDPDAVFEAG